MKQAYLNFDQRFFQGKKNEKTGMLEGQENSPPIYSLETFIPINSEILPPLAMKYFQQVNKKGFIGEGNPILYITANDSKELNNDEVTEKHNLIAEWPAFRGHLEKRIENKGLISLRFYYYTKPVEYESFEALKETCRIKDLTLNNTYNVCDLFKLIKNVEWNVSLEIFVKRMSHDSTLPAGFYQAINNHHDDLLGMIQNPERRTPLCEEVSIEYFYNETLVLEKTQASANLYPSHIYGGLFSPDMFNESNPPIRKPRGWQISSEEDVLTAEKGVEGYNKIVNQLFLHKLPSQDELKGIDLEKMLTKNFSKIIDPMVDFVIN